MKIWFVNCLVILLFGLGFSDNGSPGCANGAREQNEKIEKEPEPRVVETHYFEDGLVIQESAKIKEAVLKNIQKHDSVIVFLKDKTEFIALVERHSVDVNNTITIRAKFVDYPMGYITMSVNDGVALGMINIPEKNIKYRIKTDTETGIIYYDKPDDADVIERDSVLIPPERP